ncbi:hypothetical protein J7T55_015180 [Diaporthe amygdali]|uniref:uncharacterized protein n=1 Tax=Phomopsis amygdali TaxID=1214568 RepID=UPI0022FE564C|nr:uncharacterized protein J7T55_015180 [Diaporthe amygdali]KAJ0120453.1 hypothetical protein J7T55_015180 [Diaporthe amygdali]
MTPVSWTQHCKRARETRSSSSDLRARPHQGLSGSTTRKYTFKEKTGSITEEVIFATMSTNFISGLSRDGLK